MRRIGLLLLLILIELCAANTDTCTRKWKCKKEGGVCQRKGTDCAGRVLTGKQFCKEWEDCDCCAPPPDCRKGTKIPCKALKGTCINQDDFCNGISVINKAFCKLHDTCKCCFPGCDCDNERKCSRPNAPSVGYLPTGHCRKECHGDEESWSFCDINPEGSCKCCLRPTDCDNERKCSRPDAPSDGYLPTGHCRKECHRDEEEWGFCDINPEGSCKCCLRPTGCISKNNQCSEPYDYCVNKFDGYCPKGFGKVVGACFNKTSDCDCCKSLRCTSNGDRCTGKGEYCLENRLLACKEGYISTQDCKRAVVENGGYKETTCTCCKPQIQSRCGPYCTSSPQPVDCVCMIPGLPCPGGDGYCYNGVTIDLCGPDSCCCCKQITNPGCTSIGDRCTGKGEYCLDSPFVCKEGYTATEDCWKMVVVNGFYKGMSCTCCKPNKVIGNKPVELLHEKIVG